MTSSESMSKNIYVIGIVLLWLVAGIAVLFALLALIRMWRWIWLSSNSGESDY
jgi:hypothetical protein